MKGSEVLKKELLGVTFDLWQRRWAEVGPDVFTGRMRTPDVTAQRSKGVDDDARCKVAALRLRTETEYVNKTCSANI